MPPHLTPCQAKALSLLHSDENVFLTGAAGTGKSFLLRQFLRGREEDRYPVVASTGAAAVIVGGRTFHSFFGLGILEGGRQATVARALRSGKLKRRLQSAECVVIDEVSMLSGETLAAAEEIARRVRGDERPWGALRIIAVGDFAQLPPVTPGEERVDWAFRHPVWEWSAFAPAYLQTTVRTSDSRLLAVLNDVREGRVTDTVHAFLEACRQKEPASDFEGTRLFPRRRSADTENLRRLERIDAPLHAFATQYEGNARGVEQLKRNCPLPETLKLKTGAMVMLRKNDIQYPYRYVNGTLARVRGIDDDALFLQLVNGDDVEVGRHEFSLMDGNGSVLASALNFPVTLAWASTIHKAQGASIDRLRLDLSGLWESGHAYVALSRAKSEEGLYVDRWHPRGIVMDEDVCAFYDRIRMQWESLAAGLPTAELPDNTDPVEEPKQRGRKKRTPNHERTRALVEEQTSLPEIAETLGWKEATILKHLETLVRQKNAPDMRYLSPEERLYNTAADAFRRYGTDTLRPVYNALDGTVSFEDLRLIRVLLWQEERIGSRENVR